MKFRAASLIALTCLAGCSSFPYNSIPGPIGTVTAATGLPSETRNNRPYILAKHSNIYIGDIISTDKRSPVGLALVPGQTIEYYNEQFSLTDQKNCIGLAEAQKPSREKTTWRSLMDIKSHLSLEETPKRLLISSTIVPLVVVNYHFACLYDSSARPSTSLNCGIGCSTKFKF